MDRKALHEEFVSGHSGGSVWEIYGLIATCLVAVCTFTPISKMLTSRAQINFADFLFNWAIILASVTIYSDRKLMLASILVATCTVVFAARPKSESPKERRSAKAKQKEASVSPLSHRSFITVYRSAMMVLTITAILAVDFPIFPRRFAKTETWGTSLMDLGVGSFVFSMGVISARRKYKSPGLAFTVELKESIVQTSKVLALGLLRLISVKRLDYQEHVTEYGVHWNFFFTLGLLPFAFTIVNRIPSPLGATGKAIIVGLVYELALKNTGLQEWILSAPRVDLVSQNKEGIASFAGYLSIFMAGYSLGLNLLNPKFSNRHIVKKTAVWAVISQALFFILVTATEPSRRIANLPYVVWVIAFNSSLLCVVAAMETYIGTMPSPSYYAVNAFGELVFLFGNLTTGIINMAVDTVETKGLAAVAVLLGYQLLNFGSAKLLYSKKETSQNKLR